jgi:helix-turn-helix protein
MFTKSKSEWVQSYGAKLVFMEGEEAPETEPTQEKEEKGSEKKELSVKDMTSAQLLSTIKACIKAANDNMEDEEFGEFMEKVEKAASDYADESEEGKEPEGEEKPEPETKD